MIYDLCFDNNCLDLPSLTEIQCQGNCYHIHRCMGHVILESMLLLDLIVFDWNRYSKSH